MKKRLSSMVNSTTIIVKTSTQVPLSQGKRVLLPKTLGDVSNGNWWEQRNCMKYLDKGKAVKGTLSFPGGNLTYCDLATGGRDEKWVVRIGTGSTIRKNVPACEPSPHVPSSQQDPRKDTVECPGQQDPRRDTAEHPGWCTHIEDESIPQMVSARIATKSQVS